MYCSGVPKYCLNFVRANFVFFMGFSKQEDILGSWIRDAGARLTGLYEARQAQYVVSLLVRHLTGYTFVEQVLHAPEPVSSSFRDAAEQMLHRLMSGEPLQYVLGETEFCGHRFVVRPGVLIPRPETEELTEWVASDWKQGPSLPARKVLDVCTGSGCIAISLALWFPEASLWGLDVSPDALGVASENAGLLGAGVNWAEADFLTGNGMASMPQLWNTIISNPPYVSEEQRGEMHARVLRYEPLRALFPPVTDVLVFYRALANYARKHLVPGGAVYAEINEAYPEATEQVFREAGFVRVELRRDIRDKWRMCKVVMDI
jgi:release factor glutamine methyltransferase